MTPIKILDVPGAVSALNGRVSRQALFAAIKTGALASSKPARRRLITTRALAQWAGVDEADLALPR